MSLEIQVLNTETGKPLLKLAEVVPLLGLATEKELFNVLEFFRLAYESTEKDTNLATGGIQETIVQIEVYGIEEHGEHFNFVPEEKLKVLAKLIEAYNIYQEVADELE